MISSVVVLGGGSAGLLTALTLKRKLPQLSVRVIQSGESGAMGPGEGTTAAFPQHLFEFLKLKPRSFYEGAEPTWKLGMHFLWGARNSFNYSLAFECQQRMPQLSSANGYYYHDEYPWLGLSSAFMAQGKAFPRQQNGMPQFHNHHGYHIESTKLAGWLESRCREDGVDFLDATVRAEPDGEGIAALITETGERITADLYVDASGCRSELLGAVLGEPYHSYRDALFCDRAVIGGWPRTTEPIMPYTTAETMDAGWCWQIEHEHFIDRGYVYASDFISDEVALEEFMRKNPKVTTTPRVVKFRSGRYERCWVGNVVAVGNASGFVEPLEATALMVVCSECGALADSLMDSLQEPTPTLITLYNQYSAGRWDDIRNFLALHYKFNTLLDTPYWQACRADTALHGGQDVVDWYRDNGPSVLASQVLVNSANPFKLDGYLTVLVGMNVPYENPFVPPPAEAKFWRLYCLNLAEQARQGMGVREALEAIRAPDAKWA